MNSLPAGKSRVLIVAHFHARGAVRADTIGLLGAARQWFDQIVFVSTRLAPDEEARLPEFVEVVRRDNTGYDFFSYRAGLLRLWHDERTEPSTRELCLMNTSVVCLDPLRFWSRVFASAERPEVYGIVKTYELREHLQSWFVGFTRKVLEDQRFRQWWSSMTPIDDRARIIRDYELGLSQLLADCGYRLRGLLEHLNRMPDPLFNATSETMAHLMDIVNLSKNPAHFHWRFMMEEFGIIKVDLLKGNPPSLDLGPLGKSMLGEPGLRRAIEEALEN